MVAKLGDFTPDELALLRSLNGKYEPRVILLTARELEPSEMYERTKAELGINVHARSLDEMARVTSEIYFSDLSAHGATAGSPTTPGFPAGPR